jgi:peptide/nickel transport system permease protein
VQAVLFYSASFLFLTSLSFLGLGFSPDSPSWGQLVNDATQHLNQDPWMMVPIGAVLIFTILALNLLAAAIVEALPTTQRGVALAARAPRAVPVALAPDKARLSSPRTPSTLTAVSKDALLVIDDLTVSVPGPDHDPTNLVEGITMAVERGETVGIVGESGCGKTMTALAVLGLVPAPASVTGGRVLFNGVDVSNMSERDRTELRGKMIGLVSQEPMSALDPCFTVGSQLAEPLRLHRHLSRKSARSEAVELLATVGIHRPEVVASSYPHELSGGMAQRVAIAIALCGQPDLLIADEPTSAVDVTVQAELLDLLRELQDRYGMTLLLVTHDFGVVADICRRVVVMYAGQIVEDGPIDLVLNHQSHPYTKGLIGSIPDPTYAGRHLDVLPGSVMTPGEWPAGCHFAPRCRYALAECTTGPIPLLSIENRHECRCVRGREIMDAIAP